MNFLFSSEVHGMRLTNLQLDAIICVNRSQSELTSPCVFADHFCLIGLFPVLNPEILGILYKDFIFHPL